MKKILFYLKSALFFLFLFIVFFLFFNALSFSFIAGSLWTPQTALSSYPFILAIKANTAFFLFCALLASSILYLALNKRRLPLFLFSIIILFVSIVLPDKHNETIPAQIIENEINPLGNGKNAYVLEKRKDSRYRLIYIDENNEYQRLSFIEDAKISSRDSLILDNGKEIPLSRKNPLTKELFSIPGAINRIYLSFRFLYRSIREYRSNYPLFGYLLIPLFVLLTFSSASFIKISHWPLLNLSLLFVYFRVLLFLPPLFFKDWIPVYQIIFDNQFLIDSAPFILLFVMLIPLLLLDMITKRKVFT